MAEATARSYHSAQLQVNPNIVFPSSASSRNVSHLGGRDADDEAENIQFDVSIFSSRASQDYQGIGDDSNNVHREQEQEMEAPLPAWSEGGASRARSFAARELSENHCPSDFDPQLPLLELHSVIPKTGSAKVQASNSTATSSRSTWLPLTLRWPFLVTLFSVSLALGVVTIALSSKSAQNNGLCNNSGSSAFFFAWRFLPTLVAVFYALMITVLTNDVKRTESFAKLSRPNGSSAASSLLLVGRPWWNDPIEALRKKSNNGYRSWTFFWVSMTNVMAILLVSPLSAGLLFLDEVQISRNEQFNRLQPFHNGPLWSPLRLQDTSTDETYFRTISSVVQNLTTSAWLGDSHAVLPFWPTSFDSVPVGASLVGTPQQWKGQTSVFQAGLQCISMELTGKNTSDSNIILELSSEDGCRLKLNMTSNSLLWPPGGGWWSNTSATNYPTVANSIPPTIILNSTSECGTREMFFIASPLQSPQSNQSVARLCSSSYFVAFNVTTTVENTAISSLVSIDEKSFNETKVALDPSLVDLQNFEGLFLNQSWSAYFQPPNGYNAVRPVFGGPLILLAALLGDTGFNLNTTFEGVDLLDKAQRVKQRFFGEALQTAFVSSSDSSEQDIQHISAQLTTTQIRLIASYSIGITLGLILLLSAALIAFVLYCSRLSRRPLNLVRDPGSAAAVMLMISHNAEIRNRFRGFDKIPEDSMKSLLGETMFRIVDGMLVVEDDGKVKTLNASPLEIPQKRPYSSRLLRPLGLNEATRLDDDWRPAILRRWTGLTLLLFLASLAAALIALFVVSKGPGLHQSALVFQSTLTLHSKSVVGFAPYSIVPTIFAVAVKLWWGALEEAFKRLQPYVMMAERPTKASRGIALSYINSPMVLASGRALSKGHWLLALVCLGAFWTEVFTVGMSALWQRNVGTSLGNQQLSIQLEIRDLPQVFLVPENSEPTDTYELPVLTQVFENPFTSWLYGAVVQLAHNGSEPGWSLDGWSFAQIDLSPIPSSSSNRKSELNQSYELGALNFTESGANLGGNVNVTVRTPAIRGRIECTLHESLSNISNWLKVLDLQNSSYWNESANPKASNPGYELLTQINLSPPNSPQQLLTTTYADPARLVCCANETKKTPGLASIGYWSSNTYGETNGAMQSGTYKVPGTPTGNFTVKWIVGEAIEQQFLDLNNMSHFLWQSQPSITALNCQPIIEIANASVTLDLISGAVQEYSILDSPRNATNAWGDNYEEHNTTDVNAKPFTGYTNVTISYGNLFMSSLYNAADCARLGEGALEETGYGDEDLTDKTFNFRLPGLNVDYMSYAMFSLAQRNPSALLDPPTLQNLSNRVFSTFFQHYASTNVTLTDGGRAFQLIGATLPFGLPPILNVSGGGLSSYQDTNFPSYTNRTTEAVVHTPVEQLVMSPAAFILCLAILLFLACTTVLVYFPYAAYFKALPRDVESLASVIAFVYDSPRLRNWVVDHEHLLNGNRSGVRAWWRRAWDLVARMPRGSYRVAGGGSVDGLDRVTTGLGFFRGEQGVARWGVELEPVLRGGARNADTALAGQDAERRA